jgi:hypothetical protein
MTSFRQTETLTKENPSFFPRRYDRDEENRGGLCPAHEDHGCHTLLKVHRREDMGHGDDP